MVKKLSRHGNSAALIIERPILDLLDINFDTPLEITTDGSVLVIAPVRDEERRRRFELALQEINRRHSKALRRLAS